VGRGQRPPRILNRPGAARKRAAGKERGRGGRSPAGAGCRRRLRLSWADGRQPGGDRLPERARANPAPALPPKPLATPK